MKRFACGFYLEPLKWAVTAEDEQSAATTFANFIKKNGIKSKSGGKEFVVFEVKEN